MLSLAVITTAYLAQQPLLSAPTSKTQINTAYSQDIQSIKQEFIIKITQSENTINQIILQKRQHILSLIQKKSLSKQEITQLQALAKQYKLNNLHFKHPQDFSLLLKRVDIIPNALISAQAINESNWGRSRFAVEGNNFFGMRCHYPGCGIIPKARPANNHWEVTNYSSMTASVRAYIHTLNTHNAYQALRDLRAHMRANHQDISAFKLAEGLTAYSIKGTKYVELIQTIITRYLSKESTSQIA
ncbi:glucosaminidase domain-containing protein [Piscirickettsia salmonis]|uniref:glucosaminidase domain-containing protein n=1 Tax=Piscirickettsia salmonis TaxID=1238 RepID=UPI003EBB5C18